jgi:ribosomal protein L16 Arg81 hydroxylase
MAMHGNTLQRILHPLSIDAFVGKFFQRRSFRLPGPANKFDFLFRERDFPVGLDRTKEIRAVFTGNRQVRIRPIEIPQMYEAGATICITGMERAQPKLLRAATLIKSELNYAGSVSFRAYLSPPGSGFGLHYDARVVTTLQISGTKRWWYSREPAIPFPAYNSGKEPKGYPRWLPPPPGALRKIVLRPGDVFCLPAGVWHCAEAQGSGMSLALNLAFDHNGHGTLDSIYYMLKDRLELDERWREPLPVAPGVRGRAIPKEVTSELRRRINALCTELAHLSEDDVELGRAWRKSVRT